jgi:long-chain fatty acid transport protein
VKWIVSVLALLLLAAPLRAQGVSVHSHSGCALGRNSVGVADPCADGSAVFYNPGALAAQAGAASLGSIVLFTRNEFTFDDTGATFRNRNGTVLVPHAWFTAPVAPRVGVGVGVWAPYGLTVEWPLDFEGRFVG